MKFCEDAFVADADPLFVPFRIHQLVVVEHRIDVRQHLFHEAPGHITRRFNRRIDATRVRLFEQSGSEVRIHQALAAAQGHAAAGLTVKRSILLHYVQHLVDGHFCHRTCRAPLSGRGLLSRRHNPEPDPS